MRKRATGEVEVEVIDGKWTIERKLGQGGMGTVYLARDLQLGRQVAIKMMAAELAGTPDIVARFEREARMMARLDHPNLVPIYAVGRAGSLPFIVMKLLEGQSLGDYLGQHGRLDVPTTLALVKQACAGLQFVHDRGVVHRDLKPANMFVSPAGHLTLLDFGVARDTAASMTRSGAVVGTPRYMAPEQIQGKKVDLRADLYALATVTFEMVTGRAVFEADSDFSLMRAHSEDPPPDAQALAPVPRGFSAALLRALAKNPDERFEGVAAFYAALEAGARPEVTPEPSAPAVLAAPASPVPTPGRPVPRLRWAVAAVSLVIVGVAAWEITARLSRPTAPANLAAPGREQGPTLDASTGVEASSAETPTAAPRVDPAMAPTKAGGATTTTAKVATVDVARHSHAESPKADARRNAPATGEDPPAVNAVTVVEGEPAWAYLDVDGLRKTPTPCRLTLDPGAHELVFHRPGYQTVTRQLVVKNGEAPTVKVELIKVDQGP